MGYTKIDNIATITFAGSETGTDWVRDFTAWPVNHPYLGTIHLGFYQGMEAVWNEMQAFLEGDIAIQGHSLGAAHAQIFAGMCGTSGISPKKLTLFAPPRAGYQHLKDVVSTTCDCIYGFHNGLDPVPGVPIPLPLEQWTHVTDLIGLLVPPSGLDRIDPFKWHSLDLYRSGTSGFTF